METDEAGVSMNMSQLLEKVAKEASKRELKWALAGGLVASVYRKSPRATADIDLVMLADEKTAKDFIETFRFKPHVLRLADLKGGPHFAIKKKSTPSTIIVGRSSKKDDNDSQVGLDIILPTIPWFSETLERAQNNLIDFGFARIPALTPEDILVAKLYSVSNQSTRFMDLDDIKSILENKIEIDEAYLVRKINMLNLKIPEPVRTFFPQNVIKNIDSK